jgi:hypothetical protein
MYLSKDLYSCPALLTHAYDPSYSGCRDQEDCGSKPTQANSSARPSVEKPFRKRAGGVAQSEGTEFKPQNHIHKKKEAY